MLVFKGFTRTEFRFVVLAHFKRAAEIRPVSGERVVVLEARLSLSGLIELLVLSGNLTQERRCILLA
jgi:hypothetical protein